MELSPTLSLTNRAAVRSRNGRGQHVDPERATPIQADDEDTRYAAALRLVQAIDRDLQRGTRHYYDSAGKLLLSLDEVVQAILSNNLMVEKPATFSRSQDAVRWPAVRELVA
jgi:hypothetical protein